MLDWIRQEQLDLLSIWTKNSCAGNPKALSAVNRNPFMGPPPRKERQRCVGGQVPILCQVPILLPKVASCAIIPA
jgi:hypothetical protein